ncbi:DMT family transporter [Rodentibacter caecimuris]|uniref:Transporter n=1 Tax=Rodentibacter caecimuris TaxID=1796644 RepID=A0ABX3KZL0_9PAST|nr:transporter [Rodentibacter heylii]
MRQQPMLGFIFALITAMAWGSLPIALKQVVVLMDAQTVVWYRFLTAGLVLFLGFAYKKKLPRISEFSRYYVWLVIIAIFGLSANFFLFSSSLNYIEPSVTQIFIHVSSFTMMICGIFLFKEQLGLHQKIGIGLLLIGLGMFFNDKIAVFFTFNEYSIGVILSIAAALIWVGYGIAQKLMLRRFSAQQILMMIYLGCAFVFTPMAEPTKIKYLTPLAWGCFVYCCLNTLIGYGAYAEALNRWDVAKVSVVVTLVPLFTILFSHIAHYLAPQYFASPELNTVSYLGALVIICSAILSAIGHKLFNIKIK